jgi:hypothetical protein
LLDRCTISAKQTIISEIILNAPDGTPRGRGSSGSSFRSVWRLLVLVQDRCMVCAECTIDSKIILDTPDGTPRYEAQVEAYFGLFEDSANLHTRYVHNLHRKYHRHENHFGRTRWNCYVTWAMWNLVSVHLEMVLIFMQDRCTVCTDRTLGS